MKKLLSHSKRAILLIVLLFILAANYWKNQTNPMSSISKLTQTIVKNPVTHSDFSLSIDIFSFNKINHLNI